MIYTSDHGALGRNANSPLLNGKGSVWEGGIRVPFIVRGPGIKEDERAEAEKTFQKALGIYRTIVEESADE